MWVKLSSLISCRTLSRRSLSLTRAFRILARFFENPIKGLISPKIFQISHSVDVVIETPKGSAQKYDYVPNTPFFKMSKILPSGMVFPYDFGFIPGTEGEDGDPLDVIVISEFNSFPGVIIRCRIIGAIKAEQSENKNGHKMIRNDRYLAIPKCSNIFQDVGKMADLPKQITDDLVEFFVDYNKLEGKKFKALEKIGPREAQHLISDQLGKTH
jgi:inorganic pyrophosphatase